MPQDHPADLLPPGPEVIELGGGAQHPPRVGRSAVLRDRRLVLTIAALGLAAVCASLVAEWSVLTLPTEGPDGRSPMQVPVRVADLPTYGVAYLIGELAVTAALAVVFFGTPAIRHNCRIAGIATAGGLLALLAATTANLGRTMPWPFLLNPDLELRAEHGRGLVMAYVGTVAIGLSLYLAGRPSPAGTTAPEGGTVDPTGDFAWPWRRRTAPPDADADGRAPTDLTVAPAAPFVLPDRLDER